MSYEIFNNTFRVSPFTKAFYLKRGTKAQQLEILEDQRDKA